MLLEQWMPCPRARFESVHLCTLACAGSRAAPARVEGETGVSKQTVGAVHRGSRRAQGRRPRVPRPPAPPTWSPRGGPAARLGEPALPGRTGRAALVQPHARRAAVHDLGRDSAGPARCHPASMSRIAAAISVGPGSTAASSGGEKGTGTPGLPRRRGAVRSAPKARSVTSAMTSAWMPHVR